MTKILLFGASGFLGKSLLKKLEKNSSVEVMIHDTNLETSAQKFKGNITEIETFCDKINEGDLIVNLVGQLGGSESNLIDSNIIGGISLLNCCVKKKINRIVLISSINVYGENLERPSKETDRLDPQTLYGNVKRITERIYEFFSKTYGINVTIVRLAGVYGPTKKTGFLSQIIKATKIKVKLPDSYNNGNQQRDLLFIDDAIKGILQAIEYRQDGFDVVNISSGKRYSIREIVSIIENISKTKIPINYTTTRLDETCVWADNSKAKEKLSFIPKWNIESGLEYTIKHFFQ